MTRFHALSLALLCCAAAPALAATAIDETRPLDPRGRVEIENLKGRVQVRAWQRNVVQVTGSLGEGVEKLELDGDAAHLRIKARYPDGSWGRSVRTGPTTLIVNVPLQASLDVETVAADIDISGVAPPDLDVESVSGSITIAGAPGDADISSVSGNQRLTLNSAGEVQVESVSGDIALRGRLKGQLSAETVSGGIDIDSAGEAVRRLSLSTVSGDIGARVGLADGGQIKGETVSGDLSLHLPRSLSARVNAESFSGDLEAPGAEVKKEEFGPGSSLNKRYGSGSGEIRVETFSGDLTLSFD